MSFLSIQAKRATRLSLLGGILLIGVVARVFHAEAASISLFIKDPVVAGSTITVDVLVDSGGENINSIALSIIPSIGLSFQGYDAQASAIPLWVIAPTVEADGSIHFSGVIPGGIERGYDPQRPGSRTISIARLFFNVTREGPLSLSVDDALLLRGDGRGTALPIVTSGITTEATGTISQTSYRLDNEAPEPFTLELIDRSVLGKTPQLLLFTTVDNESAIARYELKINGGKFKKVESPYPVPQRVFPIVVTVRALDLFGNVREATLMVRGNNYMAIGFVCLVLLAVVIRYTYRRMLRKKTSLQ